LEELIVRVNYVFTNRRVSKSQHMGKDTLNRAIAKLCGIEPGRKKQPPNVMGDIEYFTVHDLLRTSRSLLCHYTRFSLPAIRYLSLQLLAPFGNISRYIPPPSASLYDFSFGLAESICRAVSFIWGFQLIEPGNAPYPALNRNKNAIGDPGPNWTTENCYILILREKADQKGC